ncbi:OsmC family protein [Larsenimonas suaedae]|uniref:OsmC family protein n=1 Tax=Larsenimonas suaedae TaxID=1851019 RepID=A0ABU1GX65_9GAMM|nr:OsmC family protein [Larsenimonas suaedae]MCM2971385.1 OsmC family protein [Larsenimonas suaedae]MDR5896641.1 OsmC family protein [Larsenimonas suaedae]
MSILIETERQGQLRQRVQVDQFDTLFGDVAEAAGGEGSAPDPHDYFDLSLGLCKAITVMMYAKRHDLALEGVSMNVSRNSDDEDNGHYELHVRLSLIGHLSPEEKTTLHDIADRCPVHRLMTESTITITTEAHVG